MTKLIVPDNATCVIDDAAYHVSGWLPQDEADVIGTKIVEETFLRWVNQMKYGKGRPFISNDHQMARFGDECVSYSYKGKKKPVYPWTSTLMDVRDRVREELDWEANCCVVNSYGPTGSLYPHRDSAYIPELGSRPTIVAVSFGATRALTFHPIDVATCKRKKTGLIDLNLGHGDLLVMCEECDEKFHHSLPEASPRTLSGWRVSLTFRRHLT